jgi:pyruvate formate-lyase activating enzyme-like uncharacterized protein
VRKKINLEAGSVLVGELPAGCEQCGPGRKMVLLVTGRCANVCFYCPLSEKKKGQDVVYANELMALTQADIVEEARLIGAQGCSMTGGDPFCELERTLEYIRLLKKEFGDNFHIHLYTSLFKPDAIIQLSEAGLDEIRFHPYPLGGVDWSLVEETIAASIGAGMATGFEIPMLPDQIEKTKDLISKINTLGLDFINLNELEFSHTNWEQLEGGGYKPVSDIQWAVQGSMDAALEILEWGKNLDITLHFCSSSFKDAVQLKNRLRNRAASVARESDVVTEEGLLIKGIIEAEASSLKLIIKMLSDEHGVPEAMMHLDMGRSRIEIAPWVLEELASELIYKCFIVEEYPTADRLEVERMPLN